MSDEPNGLHWNGYEWLVKIDGVVLTSDQTRWYRRGCTDEAEARMAARKASPKGVAEFMNCLEAIEEHWEPQTVGDMLTKITRIFVTRLTPQDRAEITEAISPKRTLFQRMEDRLELLKNWTKEPMRHG